LKDILETLAESASHSTFLALLQKSDLAKVLKAPGSFTLFAPDDQAFQRINLESAIGDSDSLAALLDYHVLEERYSAAEIAQKLELVTRSGKSLTVQLEEGEQEIDNARYVATDIACSNGVIHSIDNVFLPNFSGWYE
jgi:uncharacterized surface protein with fasciclin (FAS1) repeats